MKQYSLQEVEKTSKQRPYNVSKRFQGHYGSLNRNQSDASLASSKLFDMGFFEPSVMGRSMRGPHHNFVVIAPMIMKFSTGVKLDVFYTMVKNCDVITITSL